LKNSQILKEAIYFLNEKYEVPYEVLAYFFQVSKITIYSLKKKAKEENMDLEKIKEKIECWNSLGQKEFSKRF